MIIGIGNDIVEIARIQQAIARSERFARRILTDFEIVEMKTSQHPARYLAKKFASKEAVVKALGTGIGNGISWQMIQVEHDKWGKPLVVVSGELQARFEQLKVVNCHLSISDEKAYAFATVVLEAS